MCITNTDQDVSHMKTKHSYLVVVNKPVGSAGCRQDSENTFCCPVCKVTLRPGDFSSHVQLELNKLSKISRLTPRPLQLSFTQNLLIFTCCIAYQILRHSFQIFGNFWLLLDEILKALGHMGKHRVREICLDICRKDQDQEISVKTAYILQLITRSTLPLRYLANICKHCVCILQYFGV